MLFDDSKITDEQVRRQFYIGALEFFSWNSGKNTPNILLMLTEAVKGLHTSVGSSAEHLKSLDTRLAALEKTMKESSESSSQLAKALNRLTLVYVVLTGIGVFIALYQTLLSK